MKNWQENMLSDLIAYFESDEDVLGLLLFGSLSQTDPHPDDWSDIDLLVVVQDGKLGHYFPSVEWITYFGPLYTYSQSANEVACTTRACFADFRRVDFVITSPGKLAEIDTWPDIPFFSGAKVLFSRAKVVDEIADRTFVQKGMSPATQEQFLITVRNFRFKSMLAVYKVVRNDLLIALHLAHDLVRDCSVLGMMLRDRSTGTNIHKDGGIGNQLVKRLEDTQQPFTSMGILDSIKASNEIFEKLARAWTDGYEENHYELLDWIEKAKVELHRQ